MLRFLKRNQEKFVSDTKAEKNRLTIEVPFNIITDKNVMAIWKNSGTMEK